MPGQVETELLTAFARFAGPVRGVGVTLISVFGLLSVPTDALPLGLGLCGLVLIGVVADFTSPNVAFVLSIARVVALCAAHEQLGATDAWTLNVLTTTAITLQYHPMVM